jgi:predicted ribosomally synthesized peptide with SipW-like signal peptide
MNKKSLITMLVALCLVGAVGVGATLAYFTDQDSKNNTVVMGAVDITLNEDTNGRMGTEGTWNEDETGLEFTNVVPGETVSKIVSVEVAEESQECYIRVKAEFNWFNGEALAEELPNVDVAEISDYKTDKWFYNSDDQYFYYKGVCDAAQTYYLFDSITIPAEWDNAVANQGFNINLVAEAIQAKYLEDGMIVKGDNDMIVSWNLGNNQIQEYTPEPIG